MPLGQRDRTTSSRMTICFDVKVMWLCCYPVDSLRVKNAPYHVTGIYRTTSWGREGRGKERKGGGVSQRSNASSDDAMNAITALPVWPCSRTPRAIWNGNAQHFNRNHVQVHLFSLLLFFLHWTCHMRKTTLSLPLQHLWSAPVLFFNLLFWQAGTRGSTSLTHDRWTWWGGMGPLGLENYLLIPDGPITTRVHLGQAWENIWISQAHKQAHRQLINPSNNASDMDIIMRTLVTHEVSKV